MAGASVTIQRLLPASAGAAGESSDRGVPRRRRTRHVAEEQDRLHARGVGQILDTGLDILVSRFAVCVGVSALFWVPYQVAKEILFAADVPSGLQFGWLMLAFVPEVMTTGFVCGFVGAYLTKRELSAWAAFRSLLPAMAGLLVLSFVQMVTTGLGTCLCVLPGVLAFWLISVTPVTYVLERRELVAQRGVRLAWMLRWSLGLVLSLGRGVRLVLGFVSLARWLGWASVAFLAIWMPLRGIPSALDNPGVRLALEEVLALRGSPVEFALVGIAAVFLGVSTAYLSIVQTVYYVDQRVRKEGLDLELTLGRLEERAAPSA